MLGIILEVKRYADDEKMIAERISQRLGTDFKNKCIIMVRWELSVTAGASSSI